MKCVICQREFPYKLSFGSRPHPPILCAHCQSIHRPDGFLEVIPFWLGAIDYRPIFEQEHRDFRLEQLMMNHWEKSLKWAISNHLVYDLYIDLGELEFRSFRDWYLVLIGCQKVLMTSLFRFDFTIYGDMALL